MPQCVEQRTCQTQMQTQTITKQYLTKSQFCWILKTYKLHLKCRRSQWYRCKWRQCHGVNSNKALCENMKPESDDRLIQTYLANCFAYRYQLTSSLNLFACCAIDVWHQAIAFHELKFSWFRKAGEFYVIDEKFGNKLCALISFGEFFSLCWWNQLTLYT